MRELVETFHSNTSHYLSADYQEAEARGSLEKRAAELPKLARKARQRGFLPGACKPVNESFLEDLNNYRKDLARAFKNSNPDLDSQALTEIAQRTLDRLVFLRFLEDKRIEQQSLIAHFGDRGTAWEDFVATSRRLDGVYNGVVFKRHDILDADGFQVDERAFADICERLAPGNSPYDFNAIPLHVLGAIYERFLGKVIVAAEKRARVEDKPEVRKAGGVYYTPEYIVRYIAANTVGKLIENKTPAQIAEMRFADIACGGGSFLLGVYDLLIRRHGNYYNSLPKAERAQAVKRGDCIDCEGKLHLSIRAKREILLNNIYGVDVDAQAVEVAQWSLYLKLLEEETTTSAKQRLLEFARTANLKNLLPDLGKNIVCGNALIGRDVLDGQLSPAGEERKLNPMNFEDVFPEVMRRGGFDAVVGNPPYRRELDYKRLFDQIAAGAFGRKYQTPRMDLWHYFVYRGLDVLKRGGALSYIVNAYWTSGTGAEKLIGALRDRVRLVEVFFLGKLKVFQKVSGQHMILRVSNDPGKGPTTIKLVQPQGETSAEPFVLRTAAVKEFEKSAEQLFRNGKVDLQPPADGLLKKSSLERPWPNLARCAKASPKIPPRSTARPTNDSEAAGKSVKGSLHSDRTNSGG